MFAIDLHLQVGIKTTDGYRIYYNAVGKTQIRVENELLSLDEWKNCKRNRLGYDRDSISANPMFAGAEHHDYRLLENSPHSCSVSIGTDEIGLCGNYRF